MDGQLHGKGEYTHSDGKVFDGHWKMNKRHGQGVMFDPAKDRTSCLLEQYDNGTLAMGTRLERQPAKEYKWRTVNQRATFDAGSEGGVVMTEENTVGVPTFAQRDENRRRLARRSSWEERSGSPGPGDPDSPRSPGSPTEAEDGIAPLPRILSPDPPQRKEWSPARSSKEWTAVARYTKAGVSKVEPRVGGKRESLKLGLG